MGLIEHPFTYRRGIDICHCFLSNNVEEIISIV